MISQPQILDNFKFLAALNLNHTITAGTVATPANLAQGEVVVTDVANVVLDTTDILITPIFKLVMGRGAGIPLVESKPIKASEIKSYNASAYQPKVQEVMYFGYNAATTVGAFDVINNNYYSLNISFQNLWGTEASSMYIPVGGDFQSGNAATEEQIATGLFKNTAANLVRFNPRIATIELISAAADSGVDDAGVTVPVGALSATLPNISAGAAVGDYVRLGTGAIAGVYKIIAISGTTVTWDVPVQVAFTGTVNHVVEAVAQADSFGLRVTGVAQPFILDSRPVFLVQFQGGIKNGGTTPIVKEVSPYIGNGTYELLRQEEAASWRNQGILYNYTEFPPISIPTDLNPNGVYSVLNLGWELPSKTMLTTGNFKGAVMLGLEIDTLGTPNVYNDNIVGSVISVVDVLDALATANGFASQIGNL